MNSLTLKIFSISISVIMLVSVSVNFANAENVPSWIKNNALWYGQGEISETEFLNSIKFLIENNILVLEKDNELLQEQISKIIIPNGNFNVSGGSFYLPLNLEITSNTTVQWVNEDIVLHTIQSQDEFGNIVGLVNGALLNKPTIFPNSS